MSLNRNDSKPECEASYSLCKILDVLLFHHLKTTKGQLAEASLETRICLLRKTNTGSKSLRIISLTARCPKGLCHQSQLHLFSLLLLLFTVKPSGSRRNQKNASKWGRDPFLMKAPPVEIEFHAGGNQRRCSTKSATRKVLCNAP